MGSMQGATVSPANELRPCSATEAVARARSIIGKGGQYALGTGDYRPRVINGSSIDVPWTERESDHTIGCDCAGLICWAYCIRRHRPGYNSTHGQRYDVIDDVNCNSMLGDAMGAMELFQLATDAPQPGDVVAYPSFYLHDSYGRPLLHDGQPLHFIGHTGLVIGVSRVSAWDWNHPRFELLDIAQCRGPDGRAPGVLATDGSIWAHHNDVWPKPEHRAYLLRAVP